VLAREKARSPHDYNSEVGVINLVATKYLPSNVPLIARRPWFKGSNGSNSERWNYLQIQRKIWVLPTTAVCKTVPEGSEAKARGALPSAPTKNPGFPTR